MPLAALLSLTATNTGMPSINDEASQRERNDKQMERRAHDLEVAKYNRQFDQQKAKAATAAAAAHQQQQQQQSISSTSSSLSMTPTPPPHGHHQAQGRLRLSVELNSSALFILGNATQVSSRGQVLCHSRRTSLNNKNTTGGGGNVDSIQDAINATLTSSTSSSVSSLPSSSRTRNMNNTSNNNNSKMMNQQSISHTGTSSTTSETGSNHSSPLMVSTTLLHPSMHPTSELQVARGEDWFSFLDLLDDVVDDNMSPVSLPPPAMQIVTNPTTIVGQSMGMTRRQLMTTNTAHSILNVNRAMATATAIVPMPQQAAQYAYHSPTNRQAQAQAQAQAQDAPTQARQVQTHSHSHSSSLVFPQLEVSPKASSMRRAVLNRSMAQNILGRDQ